MPRLPTLLAALGVALLITGVLFLAFPSVNPFKPKAVILQYQITFTDTSGKNYTYTAPPPTLSLFPYTPLAVTINNVVFNTITISWLATFNIQPTTGFGWLGLGRGSASNTLVSPSKSYASQGYSIAVGYVINVTSSTNPFCAWNQPTLTAGTCYFIQPPTNAYNTTATAITSGTPTIMYSETLTQAQVLQWFTDANAPAVSAGSGYQLCARMWPQQTNTPPGIFAYANTINSGVGASSYLIASNVSANIYCLSVRYTGTSPIASIVILGITLGGASSTT